MSWYRIRLVAGQAVTEQLRDRVIFVLVAASMLLVLAALVAGPLSAGEDVKVVKDLGLALAELCGAFLAVVLGGGLIVREADRRTIVSVLSKSLPRWEFVIGKYVGVVLVILTSVVLMGSLLYLVLGVLGWHAPPGGPDTLRPAVIDPALILALLMIAAELAMLAAVAVLFSVFSSSPLLSMVLTTGVFIAGQLSGDLRSFRDVAEVPGWVAGPVAFLGWVLPDFASFDVKAQVVHGTAPPANTIVLGLAYALLYSTALVAAAAALFSRREFR
jgi:hypothetical protein